MSPNDKLYKSLDANIAVSTRHSRSRKQRRARRAAARRRLTKLPMMPHLQKHLLRMLPQQMMLPSQHQLPRWMWRSKAILRHRTTKTQPSLRMLHRSLLNHSNRRNAPNLSKRVTQAQAQQVPQLKYRSYTGNRQHESKSWRKRTRISRARRRMVQHAWRKQRRSLKA